MVGFLLICAPIFHTIIPRMRKQIAIFIVCLMFPLGNAHAEIAACPDWDGDLSLDEAACVQAGGVFENGKCVPFCTERNNYYNYKICTLCPENYPKTPPCIDNYGFTQYYAAANIKGCCKSCESDTNFNAITHSRKIAKNAIAMYGTECSYYLECETHTNATGKLNSCNSYFDPNPETGSCRSQWVDDPGPANASECDVGATGKIYIYDETTKKFKCYATACDSGYFLIKDNDVFCQLNNKDTETALGQCKKETISCATNLTDSCQNHFNPSNPDLVAATVTVTGDATWDSTKNDYDYSKCKCSGTGKLTDENGQEIGKEKLECSYNVNAGQWQNCISKGLLSCSSGYCACIDEHCDSTCKKAPAGTYSGKNDIECRKCPDGMTSELGSDAASKCGIRRGNSGTKFCDRVGCFTLPGTGFIYGYTN